MTDEVRESEASAGAAPLRESPQGEPPQGESSRGAPEGEPPVERPRRGKGWRHAALTLVALFTFVAAVAFGAVLHLDLPVTRRAAQQLLGNSLGGLFKGTITIARLERLDAGGLTALGVEVKDPEKRRVLWAQRLDIQVDLYGVVTRVARFFDKLSLVIDRVTLEGCEITLEDTAQKDEHGESRGYPSLVDAFSLRTPSNDTTTEGRPVRVWLADVRLENTSAKSNMADLPPLKTRAPHARGSVLITDKGVALDVHRMNVFLAGLTKVEMAAEGNLHLRAPGPLYGDVEARLGTLRLNESFRIEKGVLDIRGAAPEMRPEDVRGLIPDWPLDHTIAIEHHLTGVAPRLTMSATVHTERGQAKAAGSLTIAPEIEADLDVDVNELDLTALRSDWPTTNLSARSAVEIWQGQDHPNFEVNATILPSEAVRTELPPVDFRGTFDERGLLVDATLHERGLPLHLDVKGPPKGPIGFELELRKTRLEESPRLTKLVGARGTILGTVTGQVDGDHVQATTALDGSGIEYGSVGVDTLRARGTTDLVLADPSAAKLDWLLQAQGVRFAQLDLKKAELRVTGPFARPSLALQALADDGTALEATGRTRTDRVEFESVKAEVTGRGKPILLGFNHFSLHEGRLRLDDFRLESEGTLTANLDLTEAGGVIDLDGRELNLSRLSETAGLSPGTLAGRLTTRVDATIGSQSNGILDLSVKNGEFQGVTGLDLDLKTRISGRKSTGDLTLQVEEMGQLSGEWNADLAGHPFHPESYRDVTGSGKFTLDRLDLPMLSALLARDVGVKIHEGTLATTVHLKRDAPRTIPEVRFEVATSGLSVDIGEGPQPTRIDGVEVKGAGAIEPSENRLQLALRLTDYDGDVVSSGASLELPLGTWGEQLPDGPDMIMTALDAPLEAAVSIPRRRIDEFPAVPRDPDVDGTVSARGTVRGTLRDPAFQLTLLGESLSGQATALRTPIDLETSFRFRPSSGQLQGEARARRDDLRLASLNFDVVVPRENWDGELAENVPLWTGQAQLVLDGAPLDLLEPVAKNGLTGQVQGAVIIERSGWVPSVDADLRLRHLGAAGRKLGEGRVTTKMAGEKLIAEAQLDDEHGTLSATAEFGTETQAAYSVLAQNQPIYVTLRSEKYDAVVLSPFLSSVLSEFSGSLNGTLRVEFRPPEDEETGWKTRFSGNMRMSEGIITPSNMGLRLEDTSFDVMLGPEGPLNVVRVQNVKARARSETHNLTGSAVLLFSNLDLVRGQFDVTPKDFPLLSSGVKLAQLTGRASGTLEARKRTGAPNERSEMDLTVNVPELTVELPETSDRQLIELSDNPTIHILQPLVKPEEAEKTEEKPTIWNVQVALGNAVRLKSRMLNLILTGKPRLRYDDELAVDGSIELVPGGRLQVLGRVFVIDHGTVVFDTQDNTNPHLDVTATWRTPSGILVRATVGGTANKPTLDWSSEPPLPEADVVAIVLGGSGGGRDSDSNAASMSYGAAMVNELIGQSGVRGVEFYATRSSASTGQVARLSEKTWDNYTAAFQVSDELWFEGSYRQESAGPQTTQRNGFSGTLDWRFHPEWSARTEVGTLGVGADLLWQYRY